MITILKLCQRVTEETQHHAFFSYHAHIGKVEVRIFINGWEERDPDHIMTYYLDRNNPAFTNEDTEPEEIAMLLTSLIN